MITHWIITGDTHGQMDRFKWLETEGKPEETAVIILGDAGCNYYKKKKDIFTKQALEKTGFYFYLDEEVSGEVWFEPDFPHIKYFKDGGIYSINNHKTLVIGGAYSIDKWYRLQMGYMWFAQEQLTIEEMTEIEDKVEGQDFDFVLTHTCPLSWEPVDMFLRGIDQSTVDKSMEVWLNTLKNKITWKVWLFGHYHADRLERPGVEMFYTEMEDMETIWQRWTSGKELDWWLIKSPNFDEKI